MSLNELRPPLKPGERAPDFTLPRTDREGTVSLADYRGRSPLLLGLFRGLSCAFCRRAIAQLYLTGDRLRALGVETLGIVATAPGMRGSTSAITQRAWHWRPTPTSLPTAHTGSQGRAALGATGLRRTPGRRDRH